VRRAVLGADGAGIRAKARVAPYIVSKDDVIRAVSWVVLVQKSRTVGRLWPVRVEVVGGKTDFAILNECILVSTVCTCSTKRLSYNHE
jgi:hypothetical protein